MDGAWPRIATHAPNAAVRPGYIAESSAEPP
jgi:hypothetical protein